MSLSWNDIIGSEDDAYKRRKRLRYHQEKYSTNCTSSEKKHLVILYEAYQEAEERVVEWLSLGIEIPKSMQIQLAKKIAKIRIGNDYDKRSWRKALGFLKSYHESSQNDIYWKFKHLYMEDDEYARKNKR